MENQPILERAEVDRGQESDEYERRGPWNGMAGMVDALGSQPHGPFCECLECIIL
jgi:hypothetical protein